jgi:curved DNA-binding protein CbpA
MVKLQYFSILEIPQDASKAEIKKAYRKKVMQVHPDVNANSNAHDTFLKLNEAFAALYYGKWPKKSLFQEEVKKPKTESGLGADYYEEFVKRSTNSKNRGARSYRHTSEFKASENREKTYASPKPAMEKLSPLGKRISLGFFYVLRVASIFFLGLPIFVIFKNYRLFFQLSTVASLFMGFFLLKHSSDWIRELRIQLKK